MAGVFIDTLNLNYIDGRWWEIASEFTYSLNSREVVNVPAKFVTDFASIPRIFWNFFPPAGTYGKGAVIHDWLYQYQGISSSFGGDDSLSYIHHLTSRYEADNIFMETMRATHVKWSTRWILYLGVRLGGWVVWKRYRREEKDI